MKTLSRLTAILTFVAATVLPAQAAGDDGAQQRLKVALNGMVQEVKQAETPTAKRAVMEHFLNGLERNAMLMDLVPFTGAEKQAALDNLQEKFNGYQAELNGLDGNELDAFAGFMQQDLEQAGNSGIYLSTGAIIIILLILILVL